MPVGIYELDELGLRIKPNTDQAFVFDIYDAKGNKLNKEEFNKTYGEILSRLEEVQLVGPKICAEGDSWINILWPLSSVLGHERTFFDVMQRTHKYRTLDQAWPGDTLENMISEKEYRQPIQSNTYDWFIFSGAGNDVLGGGKFKKFLKHRTGTDPSQPVETWLETSEVNKAFDFIAESYELVAREIETWSSTTIMLIHGYDYPVPRENGVWLGNPLSDRGYDLLADAVQISKIMKYLVDRLHAVLESVASNHSRVRQMDLRNTIQGRWNDELHPKFPASQEIAAIFMTEIDATV